MAKVSIIDKSLPFSELFLKNILKMILNFINNPRLEKAYRSISTESSILL